MAASADASTLSWTTNLSEEQIARVNFCAESSGEPPEEVLAFLEGVNWDEATINNKLDLVTSGAEKFNPMWQSKRKKKKKNQPVSTGGTGNPNSNSNNPQQSKKSKPQLKSPQPNSKSRKDRRQGRDKQGESGNAANRRQDKPRSERGKKGHARERESRQIHDSPSSQIQSSSRLVSDASYADRAKPSDGSGSLEPKSPSNASTPSASSRTPSHPRDSLSYGTPHFSSSKQRGRGRRYSKPSPNDRQFHRYDDSNEPREQYRGNRIPYDRYNQYSHPNEVPPRHAQRRPMRHANGNSRKFSSNHFQNGGPYSGGSNASGGSSHRSTGRTSSNENSESIWRQSQSHNNRGANSPSADNGIAAKSGHPDLFEDVKTSLDTMKSFENADSAEFDHTETQLASTKYPTGTLDLTVVTDRGLQEDDISSEKSDRSDTNIANSVKALPVVTPRAPSYSAEETFPVFATDVESTKVDDETDVVNSGYALSPSSAAEEHAVSKPSQAGPTRPPIKRGAPNSGMTAMGDAIAMSKIQAPVPQPSFVKQAEPTVAFPEEVEEEVKEAEPEFQFGQPDFVASENVLSFVGDIEARMERGFDEAPFEGQFGIPTEIVSDLELDRKSGEELNALFSQFAALPVFETAPVNPTATIAATAGPPATVSTFQVALNSPTASSQQTHSSLSLRSAGVIQQPASVPDDTSKFQQSASAPVAFGRRQSSSGDTDTSHGGQSGFPNRVYDHRTPDSQSPEHQYGMGTGGGQQGGVGVPPARNDQATHQPIVFNSTAMFNNKLPGAGAGATTGSYSPNMAHPPPQPSNVMFQAVTQGSGGLPMNPAFGVGQPAPPMPHHQQQVVPPNISNLAPPQHAQTQPQLRQGIPHMQSGPPFTGPPQQQTFAQMPRQHSHPMSHGPPVHGNHPAATNQLAPPQFGMGLEDDRGGYTHMGPNQMMGMEFGRNFQAQAPPPPPHTQNGAFGMHPMPQQHLGMHPQTGNPQLPQPHLPLSFGGGMNRNAPGPPNHLGPHGPQPMFPHPQAQQGTAHAPPPMQSHAQPPQHLMGPPQHIGGPHHPTMFDQQQYHTLGRHTL